MVSSEYLSEPCSVKGITIVGEAKTGDVDPGATVPSGPAGVVPNPSMGTAGAQIMVRSFFIWTALPLPPPPPFAL